MAKTIKSIEERIEDWCKKQFAGQKYYTKTDFINSEIESALEKAPSKQGGSGKNYPDIKCLLTVENCRRIPVMIEVKGIKGCLIKVNDKGEVDNVKKNSEPNYQNISKYAVNGAVHYANAILSFADSYKEVLAIGVNGYDEAGDTIQEVDVWYVSKDNLFVPKHVGSYEDISFLLKDNIKTFIEKVDALVLTPEELEERKLALEDEIERKLKALNQSLHDKEDVIVEKRVQLVAGLIMAGLGTDGVPPLRVEELLGREDEENNDGQIIMSKIKLYLAHKNLPEEKIEMITDILNVVFTQSSLQVPKNGESKLHTIYAEVKRDVLPYLTGELHNIDFTGRLFNVMNDWIATPPDGDKNDVVLTPRYVTELMARLCEVNMNSYVWDFALGSGGFLISAMHHMIDDAKQKINSPHKLEEKISHIKMEQLLGIEKLPEVYMLAVLNMILMKDGSANIIQGNSLEYDGNYKQGKKKNKPFPANVFLLNPPYSTDGKGFVFVERALGKMTHGGRAAVLIQENAGNGNGLPFTANILKNNTLRASIKMSEKLFIGKASVQTAIYVFEVNRPHNAENDLVRFIDFSNDGYTRMNRKKSGQSVNLRDTDHAKERYDEVCKLVLYGKGANDKNLHYFKDCYTEDYITLSGNDWTYGQHRKIDTVPTEEDFQNVVSEYLSWKVEQMLKGENNLGK